MSEQKNNLSKIAEALSKARSEMTSLIKDKENPFFNSKYASLASVYQTIKEPLFDNGLTLSQPFEIENCRHILRTLLIHKSGEYLESKMILPDLKDPQKIGSAITYYRRYSIMALIGISEEDEDDDGNSASSGHKKISRGQVSKLEELINVHISIRKRLLETCDGAIENLTVDRFEGAMKWVSKSVDKIEGSVDIEAFKLKFQIDNPDSPACLFIEHISNQTNNNDIELTIQQCAKEPDVFEKNLDRYKEKVLSKSNPIIC